MTLEYSKYKKEILFICGFIIFLYKSTLEKFIDINFSNAFISYVRAPFIVLFLILIPLSLYNKYTFFTCIFIYTVLFFISH